jgi:hypothetical protein
VKESPVCYATRGIPPGCVAGTVERVVQFSQPAQARAEHRLIRGVALIRPIQQRHVSGLAHQDPKPDHAKVTPLALCMPTASQRARGRRGDVGVEVGRVERQHIRRQAEPAHRRLCDRNLRPCARSNSSSVTCCPMRWNVCPVNLEAGRQQTRGTLPSRNSARSRLAPGTHARWIATATTISPTDGPVLAPG